MSFTRLKFLKSWLSSTDFPTLEASEEKVREDFQYHPNAILEYLNTVLLKELEENGAGSVGTADGRSVEQYLGDLYKAAQELEDTVHTLASGGDPEAFKAAKVVFTAEEWEDGQLSVPKESHKRKNDAFVYSIRALTDEGYVSNSWYGACTDVAYNAETEVITLSSEEAYSGEIVFYGL